MGNRTKHQSEDFLFNTIQACIEWCESGAGFGATSQITGAGAIEEAEMRFSALHSNRPALLTASATYGIRSALRASGVGVGDIVMMPKYDWPASYAAALSIGAVPRLMPVAPDTFTLDPNSISKNDLSETKAICATHIYGTPADIPAIREKAGDGIAIIEDCAQAIGSSLDGRLAGTLGSDYAVYSFGPGKQIDTGEGGMILSKDWDAYEKVLKETQHPVRQIRNGAGDVDFCAFSIRPHPLTAVLLLQKLKSYEINERQSMFGHLVEKLSGISGCRLIGVDNRRRNAQLKAPAVLDGCEEAILRKYSCTNSGAFDLGKMSKAPEGVTLIAEQGSAQDAEELPQIPIDISCILRLL